MELPPTIIDSLMALRAPAGISLGSTVTAILEVCCFIVGLNV